MDRRNNGTTILEGLRTSGINNFRNFFLQRFSCAGIKRDVASRNIRELCASFGTKSLWRGRRHHPTLKCCPFISFTFYTASGKEILFKANTKPQSTCTKANSGKVKSAKTGMP